MTELVLARSGYTGAPVRLNANREFLARAVRLGFTEVEVADADSPVVLRDGDRVFCFQPLSKESAIGPTDDVTRIESPSPGPRPAPKPVAVHQRRVPRAREDHPGQAGRRTSGATPNGPAATVEGPAAGGLAALIQEAEALHEALADARARAGRLTVALRRYRRRERLVSQHPGVAQGS